MINYNIPSVVTSIIDRSFLSTEKAKTRTPLIIGFSKYGDEDHYYEFATSKEAEYKLGKLDFQKYGLGLLYLRDSLRNSFSAIFKRLMPTDATFANFSIDNEGEGHHYDKINEKDNLLNIKPCFCIEPEDENSQEWLEWYGQMESWEDAAEERKDLVLTHLAKGRGSAYNDIYVVYSAATDYEKMDSNEEGETNYKFNYVRADIYEKTPVGFIGIGDPIVFSLIDKNLDTNQPIVDQYVGLELFANIRVKEANDMLTINITDDHLPEIRQNRTVDDLMPEGRLIVPDYDNSILEDKMFYEVKVVNVEDADGDDVPTLKPIATEMLPTGKKLGYIDLINPYAVANSLKVTIVSDALPEGLNLDTENFEATSTDEIVDQMYDNYCAIYGGFDLTGGVTDVIIENSAGASAESTVFDIAYKITLNDGTVMDNYDLDANGTKILDTNNGFTLTLPAGAAEKAFSMAALASYFGYDLADMVDMELHVMSVTTATQTLEININYSSFYFLDAQGAPNNIRIERDIPSDSVFKLLINKPLSQDTAVEVELTSVSQSGIENSITKNIIIPSNTTMHPFDVLTETADQAIELKIAKDIVVQNGKVIILPTTYITDDEVTEMFYLDGDKAFYELMYNFTDDSLTFKIHKFLRHTIYRELVGDSGAGKSIKLWDGFDGENLFDKHGNISFLTGQESIVGLAESATDTMVKFLNDNTELREVLYPKYDFDYVPDWTENPRVISAINTLTDDIGLSMGIASIPVSYDVNLTTMGQAQKDVDIREGQLGGSFPGLYKSNYNMMLYSSQKNKAHLDDDTNINILMPTSYYALMNHLEIDQKFSVTEPVANIEKGLIPANRINLLYEPTSKEIEDLRMKQINAIIVEDETYFIDQLTAYKKASKLSRANIVKTLHRVRKDLPKVLKPFLQLKATAKIINEAVDKTRAYMNQWLVTEENQRHGLFQTIDIVGNFNQDTHRLKISITVNPVGTIEIIDVPIIVV